jgi:hypothetical protein
MSRWESATKGKEECRISDCFGEFAGPMEPPLASCFG